MKNRMTYMAKIGALLTLSTALLCLSACGFHLQGERQLAEPLHRMYLHTPDPYGHLARDLEQFLKMSHVQLVATPEQATTILNILQDANSQSLLSVSGTQQTRQYNLTVSVQFEITDTKGHTIVPTQTLKEARAITIQSNQILGSSNEASLMYQQIRRSLASAIINRLASEEISQVILRASPPPAKKKPS